MFCTNGGILDGNALGLYDGDELGLVDGNILGADGGLVLDVSLGISENDWDGTVLSNDDGIFDGKKL